MARPVLLRTPIADSFAGPPVPALTITPLVIRCSFMPPSSLIRPFSTLRPRNHLPSPCGCHPWCRSTSVTGTSRGSAGPAQVVAGQDVPHLFDPVVGDHVLEPGPLAVGPVPVVAEELDHRLRRGHHLVGLHVADGLAWEERCLVAVRHAHAAADQHVVPAMRPFCTRPGSPDPGVHVHAVVLAAARARLELRQVHLPVDRLDRSSVDLGAD